MVRLNKLTAYLNDYLRIHDFSDPSQNGLQVEGKKEVHKVAFAVDARLRTFQKAVKAKADLLITHHGLFWGRSQLLRGTHYQRIKTLLDNDLALYTAHLPLDAHMEVGNNAVLARAIGLEQLEPWAEFKGQTIGVRGVFPDPPTVDELMERANEVLTPFGNPVVRYGRGSKKIKKMGIVTGDAASEVIRASRNRLDAFLTGEPDHVMAMEADERKVHFLCGGHYATETFGVRALSEHIEERFDIETIFIDAPTFA